MNDRKKELATLSMTRLLWRYSTPAILGMLADAVYTFVDAIFIGRGVGVYALGALAVTFPIQLIMLGCSIAVGIGAASIISRALGADEDKRAAEAAGNSFTLVVVIAVSITIFGLLFQEPLIKLFGAHWTVQPHALSYMSILFMGAVPIMFASSTVQVVRAEGNVRLAMVAIVTGTVANIVLDALFIFDFKWGIGGAAFATVLSAVLSSAILLSGYFSGGSIARPSMRDLIPKISLCIETLSIGASSFARLVSASFVGLFVNNSILYYGGPFHLSVLSMIYRVMILASLPIYGIGHGVQPIVGFNYGAGNTARVREAIMTSLLWSGSIAMILWAIMMSLAEPILQIFSSFSQLAVRGVPMLRIIIFVFPLIVFRTIGSSLFQALGKPFPALMTNVANQFLFLPIVVILPLYAGRPGIWLSYPLADFLSFIVVYVLISLELKRLGIFNPVVSRAD